MIRFPIFHRGGVGWGELGWGGAGVGFPKSTCSKGAEKENVSHQLRKRRIRNGRQYKKSDLPPQRPLCTPVDPTYPDIIGRCLHLHFTLYVVCIHFISQDNSQLLRFEHCLHMQLHKLTWTISNDCCPSSFRDNLHMVAQSLQTYIAYMISSRSSAAWSRCRKGLAHSAFRGCQSTRNMDSHMTF